MQACDRAFSGSLRSSESLEWDVVSPTLCRTSNSWPVPPLCPTSAIPLLAQASDASQDSADTVLDCQSIDSTPISSLTVLQSIAAPGLCLPASGDADGAAAAAPTARRSPRFLEAMQRSVRLFAAAVASSSLTMSALAHMELSGSHPLPPGPADLPLYGSVPPKVAAAAGPLPTPRGSLQTTLASMLTLFLRSGKDTVREEDLLAMLWVMESWDDAHRSPATVVLGDYIRHLAAFDPARADTMTASWEKSFTQLRAGVVDAQLRLLQAVNWSLGLTGAAVAESYQLLFGHAAMVAPPEFGVYTGKRAAVAVASAAAEAEAEAHAAAAATAAGNRGYVPAVVTACAVQMDAICGRVRVHAQRVNMQTAVTRSDADECTPSLAKRQRMM